MPSLDRHGDEDSVRIIGTALETFSTSSGLNINQAKSRIYLSGVDADMRGKIQRIVGIEESNDPITYLGLPLITTRLTNLDCMPLIQRITAKIKLWTSSSLSYAGRLQLVKSVLFAIQTYWSTKLILPCATVRRMESILSAFIWKGPSMQTTGAKVAWAKICRPVQEGGLGLKSISHWNRAAVGKLLWGLITNKTSLWASWIHTVRLRGRSFWNVQIPNSCSWSWRQILHARNWCKHHIRWRIGNGESSFLWQDNWLPSGCEIGNIISPRQLAHTGLSWNAKVAEIVRGRAWQFPTGVSTLDMVWQTIDYLPNSNQEDTFLWKGTSSGIYTIQSAWELTRPHHNTCMAHEFIWHVGHIPRQAFMLWLTYNQRLQTLDRVQRFMGPSAPTTCVLCGEVDESHDHLFFLCRYSSKIWKSLNARARIHWPNLPWSRLKNWAIGRYRNKRKTKFIIPKLLLASAIYHIWYERNRRSFNNHFSSAKTVEENIFQLIRAHLTNGVNVGDLPPAQRLIWEV